jgi:TPR repeat protein
MSFRACLFALLMCGFCSGVYADPCDEVWNGPEVNAEALDTCKKLAEDGNVDAQFRYGLWLIQLPGKYENAPEGIKWLRKSAQNGKQMAQLAMAKFLSSEDFDETLIDYVEAYAWYAVLDHEVAMTELSSRMQKPDLERARKLAREYIEEYKREK